MDSSLLLARFIGPFIIVIGIGLLFNLKRYRQIAEDFQKNAALIYLGGLITFIMGLAIVLYNNVWAADWRLIITIFGWLTVIKGVWLIVFPQTLAKFTGVFIKNTKLLMIPWIIMLALGIFLSVKGYGL